MHPRTIEIGNAASAGDAFPTIGGTAEPDTGRNGNSEGTKLPTTGQFDLLPPADYGKLHTLLRSRKFWTMVAATTVTVYLYARGELSAENFADSAALIAGIYVGSVALEDGLRSLVTVWTRNGM